MPISTTFRALGAAALVGALLCGAPSADAAPKKKVKVPKAGEIQKQMNRLFSGEINYESTGERERAYIEIDRILAKDKKGVAIRHPAFWTTSINSAWFGSKKGRKPEGKAKQLKVVQCPFFTVDEKEGEVPLAVHGGKKYRPVSGHTLILSVLPQGTDPKEYLEQTWMTDETAVTGFVLAAVAETPTFRISKEPRMIVHPILKLREMFNIDSNRWFIEAVGDACEPVQDWTSKHFPDRIAGIILRNPTKGAPSINAKMFSGVVVAKSDDEAAKLIFSAYEALNDPAPEKPAGGEGEGGAAAPAAKPRFTMVDGADAAAANAQVSAWIDAHEGRETLSSYEWTTLINADDEGEKWSGSLFLESPAKRGVPTTLKVDYDREKNVISIDGDNIDQFRVYMNDDLLDLDKEVAIVVNGEEVARKIFPRSLRTMLDDAFQFGEFGRLYCTSYGGAAPAAPTEEEEKPEEGEKKKDEGGDGK